MNYKFNFLFIFYIGFVVYGQQNTNSYIIHLKTNNTQLRKQINFESYTSITENTSIPNLLFISIPKDSNASSQLENLYKNPNIIRIEEDFIQHGAGKQNFTPSDQKYNQQWSLKNNGTFNLSPSKIGADINIEPAWNIEKGSKNSIVAVIDTGCEIAHPEFQGRLWSNKKEIPNNNIDDDNNGYIDDINGWDFVNNDNNPSDDHGHGTNVAGIIAANSDNGIGFSGIDMNCQLMSLKSLNQENSGKTSDIISAIYYAVDNGANVINLSLGGGHSVAYKNAIQYAIQKNVVVVASMMNNNNDTVNYPAGYENVIAVGSTNPDDTRSSPFFWSETSGSSYGKHISVVAPGNYIFSISNQLPDKYNRYWGGTSQAAPHVTGLVSLLLSQNKDLTPSEIKSIIETTADDQVGNPLEDVSGFDIYYGHGRINALKALSRNLSTTELELFNKPNIDIYPNPAVDFINLEIGQSTKLPNNIYIYNTYGQLVYNTQIRDVKNTLNFNLASGIYVLQLDEFNYKFIVK